MPPKPFLLYGAGALPPLKASSSVFAPFTAGTPKLSAAWPERKLTIPILKSSAAAVPAMLSAIKLAAEMAVSFFH